MTYPRNVKNNSCRYIILLALLFSYNVALCVSVSAQEDDEEGTWDKIKHKAKQTTQMTKLEMKHSKYSKKIEEEYTELGRLIYENRELREKIKKEKASRKTLSKLSLYHKKRAKFLQMIQMVERGEEVTAEEIEEVEEGFGLDDEYNDQNSPEQTTDREIPKNQSDTKDDGDIDFDDI